MYDVFVMMWEDVVTVFFNYSCNRLDRLRNTTKTFAQDNRYLGRDLTIVP